MTQQGVSPWSRGCVNARIDGRADSAKMFPMRPLSETESRVLSVMLALDFPGAPELRAQVSSARVVGRCSCGCPTIDIKVSDDVDRAVVQSETPVDANVDGIPGAGLIVFVRDGRLSCLEYYFSEDPPPNDFPPTDLIRPYAEQ
jgi:hypothetical protein